LVLTTVQQYERPESSSVEYTVEVRTYDGDGAAVNADSTPTLTATGSITGSLGANLGTVSTPATGVYRWQYTTSSVAVLEQVRFDVSATMSSVFTLSAYSQICDFVSATWTTSDRDMLEAVWNKLPLATYLTGTSIDSGRPDSTSLNAIADAIWDDVLVDHVAAGSFGAYVGASLATQASVNDLPTNSELATALASSDDATLAAVAALSIPTTTQINTAIEAGAVGTGVTTLLSRLSAARAAYLDHLNVGGVVASQADIMSLNQSASRRLILTTVQQYERPESSGVEYTVEVRTYDGDGAAVNADSAPTLTAIGSITGSLAANIGTVTNPSTGVYRWQYTVSPFAALEQIRFEASATMGIVFVLAAYSQVCDFVSATWTTSDRTKLEAVFDKLPSRAYLSGTTVSTGAPVTADYGLATGNMDTQFGLVATETSVATLSTKIGTPVGASVAADIASVKTDTTTLLARIPAALFAGITSLGKWLGLVAGKGGDPTTLTEMQATPAGATFTNVTDSLEAAAGNEPLVASVAAAGSLPTRDQALLLLHQRARYVSVSGTTETIYAVDGTTALAANTLTVSGTDVTDVRAST
jgi:hypothetical protein